MNEPNAKDVKSTLNTIDADEQFHSKKYWHTLGYGGVVKIENQQEQSIRIRCLGVQAKELIAVNVYEYTGK